MQAVDSDSVYPIDLYFKECDLLFLTYPLRFQSIQYSLTPSRFTHVAHCKVLSCSSIPIKFLELLKQGIYQTEIKGLRRFSLASANSGVILNLAVCGGYNDQLLSSMLILSSILKI